MKLASLLFISGYGQFFNDKMILSGVVGANSVTHRISVINVNFNRSLPHSKIYENVQVEVSSG